MPDFHMYYKRASKRSNIQQVGILQETTDGSYQRNNTIIFPKTEGHESLDWKGPLSTQHNEWKKKDRLWARSLEYSKTRERRKKILRIPKIKSTSHSDDQESEWQLNF